MLHKARYCCKKKPYKSRSKGFCRRLVGFLWFRGPRVATNGECRKEALPICGALCNWFANKGLASQNIDPAITDER